MPNISFTNKYALIDSIRINNVIMTINFPDSTRWICDLKKDSISAKGDYTVSLFDNYGESYMIKMLNRELTYETRKIKIVYDQIMLYPQENTLNQFPDIVINVLKTIDHPVGLETLRRITEQVHSLPK